MKSFLVLVLIFLTCSCQVTHATVSGSAFQSVWKQQIVSNNKSEWYVFENHLYESTDIIFYMVCKSKFKPSKIRLTVQWKLGELNCKPERRILTDTDMTHTSTSNPSSSLQSHVYMQRGSTGTVECSSDGTVHAFKDESNQPYYKQGIYGNKEMFIKKIYRKDAMLNETRRNRVTKTWDSGIYQLFVRVQTKNPESKETFLALAVVKMSGPYGYLPAIQFPLLPFNAVMALLHLVMATFWVFIWIKNFKHTVSFHLILGVITVAAAIGYVFQLIDLIQMNANGEGKFTVMWAANVLSCVQGSLFAALLMAVSLGYGISRPQLSWCLMGTISALCTLKFSSQVAWFIIDNIDFRYHLRQKHLTVWVLVIQFLVQLVIGGWIVIGSIVTLSSLIKRRHAQKLKVFGVYCGTAFATFLCLLVTGILSMVPQITGLCSHSLWRYAWIPNGSWSMSTLILLAVIMYMWKPGDMDRYYAFQPLVDQEQKEEEEIQEKAEKIKLDDL